MRYSKLFSKTRKDYPSDETAKNAQLLIRAGYINKEMAGVYAYLPLGLKVVEKIKTIIREEMNDINGQELIMTNLQPSSLWKQTGRWDDDTVDVWFKSKLKDDSEVGLAWSHEEPIVQMMKQYIASYKDLPISVYQFQTKLRNEERAKSGIMRGREFVMKDMYSLARDAEQHDSYYQSVMDAYTRIYQRMGIGEDTYITYASGGAFTKYSHEFQTVCEVGEDIIYLHRDKNIAINEEVLNSDSLDKLGVKKEELEKVSSSEVGNIFNFGTDKSEKLGLEYTDENGNKQFVHLGSYGVGVTRLMGVIVEKYSDDKGIVWPENIAPAKVYLVSVGVDSEVIEKADSLYDELTDSNIETLYDDRDLRPGQKFADADLLGIPYRVVISPKTISENKIELKKRTDEKSEIITKEELLKRLSKN